MPFDRKDLERMLELINLSPPAHMLNREESLFEARLLRDICQLLYKYGNPEFTPKQHLELLEKTFQLATLWVETTDPSNNTRQAP